MNGKRWSNRVGGGVGVGVFIALVTASVAGCGLLKPKQKQAFGTDCTTDLDCESMTCSTDGNICSKSCTYDTDCGGEVVCRRKDDGTGNWCSKALGVAPNGACMATQDCQHNECLKYVGKEDQPGLCTKYCATEADCPAGMKICLKISDSGLLKVCLPGDPAAPASARPQFAPAVRTPKPAPGQPRPQAQPRPTPQPQQPTPAAHTADHKTDNKTPDKKAPAKRH